MTLALVILLFSTFMAPAAWIFVSGSISGLNGTPKGKFAGYDFFPHHELDVLEFRNGEVWFKSTACCGTKENFGAYEHVGDGTWVWTYKGSKRFELEPKGTTMTIRCEDDPTINLVVQRRLMERAPF